MLVFYFQELLVILCLLIVVTPLPPKIRIMTATTLTVLWALKEPGGTRSVITPTWTVCIITDNTHQTLMVSTGITGKDISTPPREPRWKSDQWSFKNSPVKLLVYLLIDAYKRLKKKCFFFSSDWAIKICETWVWSSFIAVILSLVIFHFELQSLFCLPFLRSPSLVPLSCSFPPEKKCYKITTNNFWV